MDAFFVACEVRRDPTLKGKPVDRRRVRRAGRGCRGVVRGADIRHPLGDAVAPRQATVSARALPPRRLRAVLRGQRGSARHLPVGDRARRADRSRRGVPRCDRGAAPARRGGRDRIADPDPGARHAPAHVLGGSGVHEARGEARIGGGEASRRPGRRAARLGSRGRPSRRGARLPARPSRAGAVGSRARPRSIDCNGSASRPLATSRSSRSGLSSPRSAARTASTSTGWQTASTIGP